MNFSIIKRDLYGTATLVPPQSAPKTQQTLMIYKVYVNDMRAARSSLNAEPAVWVGVDDSTDGESMAVEQR